MRVFTLVDDIRKVLESLRAQRGEFTLAMLYSDTPEAASIWNLIISAPWADQLGIVEATRVIAFALNQGLGLENQTSVSRVTVLKTSDPFVLDMTALYPIASPGAGVPLSQVTAGQLVGSGFVFYSRKAA